MALSPTQPPVVLAVTVVLKQTRGIEGAKNLAVLRPSVQSSYVGTFNVRTFNSDRLVDLLLQEIDAIRLDVLAVNEARRKTDLNARWNDGTQVMLGAAEGRVGGIGFIVRPQLRSEITSCDILTPRIGVLVINIDRKVALKIVAVYASTSASDDGEVERF